jgi:hypothetical protein
MATAAPCESCCIAGSVLEWCQSVGMEKGQLDVGIELMLVEISNSDCLGHHLFLLDQGNGVAGNPTYRKLS